MTAPLTDIDQATRDELQPPCDAPRDGHDCDQPAAWVAWLSGPFPSPHVLLCDDHADAARAHDATCRWCQLNGIRLHLEPLDRRPE